MSDLQQTITNFDLCWSSLTDLFAGLDAEQWATQSLCPDWTVAGVASHLISVEEMLAGWEPDGDNPPPFEKVAESMNSLAEMSGDELRASFVDVTGRRRTDLADADQLLFDSPSFTPVGVKTYGRFMAIRVFDFWVHEQDIRTPLGIPGHEGGPAAEMALEEVKLSMGYIAGKLIGLSEGQSLLFRLSGGLESEIAVAVDGRAGVVDSVSSPTATVDADALAFIQLACGRIDPQLAIDAGRISWSGDAELGEKAARSLKFTM